MRKKRKKNLLLKGEREREMLTHVLNTIFFNSLNTLTNQPNILLGLNAPLSLLICVPCVDVSPPMDSQYF